VRRRRQSRILRFLPEGISASRGLLAGRRDRHLADPTVLTLVDSNKPIPHETSQVAGQCGPLQALEIRKPRGRQWASLNQRRQERELGAPHARPSHRLFEETGQLSAPPPRGGAHALPAGDEVDFLRFHIRCVYTFIVAVKARDERGYAGGDFARVQGGLRSTRGEPVAKVLTLLES
jgi:hypothetical protein